MRTTAPSAGNDAQVFHRPKPADVLGAGDYLRLRDLVARAHRSRADAFRIIAHDLGVPAHQLPFRIVKIIDQIIADKDGR